jgi:ClpP class serine protease
MLYDYSAMFNGAGIKAIPIDTGEFKSAGAMGLEITEAQIKEFQKIVDGYFADFSEAVLEGRPISKADFDAIADGRIFFADDEPVKTGLITGIKSTRQALSDMLVRGDNISSNRYTAQARLKMLDI